MVVRAESILDLGRNCTYIHGSEKGGFEAVIVHRHILDAQQTVYEQGLESSQELPFIELRMLVMVIPKFKITTADAYLGKYFFLLKLDKPPYKIPAGISSRFEQRHQAHTRK